MGFLDGLVRIAIGLLLLAVAAGIASCSQFFLSLNDLLRLTIGTRKAEKLVEKVVDS